MRFIDEAIIHISAGHGGAGCVAFRREKYEPRGGPNGGSGGRGGDIRFVATNNLSTLQDFRYRKIYKAENGRPGLGSNCTGPDGQDIEILVPMGTVIRDENSGNVLHDFTENGQVWVAAKGGRGGKGNAYFATPRFQAPKFAQPGEEGEIRNLHLELKLLADVGIIGFPNAGKSTLISRISAARPKIADYAFTTKVPNLGVVSLGEYQSMVVADIPGLIKNAHKGYGLGHRFLKHIERTKGFIHLLDATELLQKHGIDRIVERYNDIRNELELFNPELLLKEEIICVNKSDVIPEEEWPPILKKLGSKLPKMPVLISAVTGAGIPDVLRSLQKHFMQAIPLPESMDAARLGLRTESSIPLPNALKPTTAGAPDLRN